MLDRQWDRACCSSIDGEEGTQEVLAFELYFSLEQLCVLTIDLRAGQGDWTEQRDLDQESPHLPLTEKCSKATFCGPQVLLVGALMRCTCSCT